MDGPPPGSRVQTAELRNGLNLKCFELERLTVSREEAAALAKQALLLPPRVPFPAGVMVDVRNCVRACVCGADG